MPDDKQLSSEDLDLDTEMEKALMDTDAILKLAPEKKPNNVNELPEASEDTASAVKSIASEVVKPDMTSQANSASAEPTEDIPPVSAEQRSDAGSVEPPLDSYAQEASYQSTIEDADADAYSDYEDVQVSQGYPEKEWQEEMHGPSHEDSTEQEKVEEEPEGPAKEAPEKTKKVDGYQSQPQGVGAGAGGSISGLITKFCSDSAAGIMVAAAYERKVDASRQVALEQSMNTFTNTADRIEVLSEDINNSPESAMLEQVSRDAAPEIKAAVIKSSPTYGDYIAKVRELGQLTDSLPEQVQNIYRKGRRAGSESEDVSKFIDSESSKPINALSSIHTATDDKGIALNEKARKLMEKIQEMMRRMVHAIMRKLSSSV